MLALLLVSPVTVVVATPGSASAALPKCTSSRDGDTRKLVGAVHSRYVVKQIDQDENFSGKTKKLTFRFDRSSTISNNVSAHGEVTASMKAGAFGSLEAKVGSAIGHQHTSYAFSSMTETLSLATGDVYFRARGVRKYTLLTRWVQCVYQPQPGAGGWQEYARATAAGHVRAKTIVGCKQKTSAGSMARYVKTHYCP
jgi:hypothetical protein